MLQEGAITHEAHQILSQLADNGQYNKFTRKLVFNFLGQDNATSLKKAIEDIYHFETISAPRSECIAYKRAFEKRVLKLGISPIHLASVVLFLHECHSPADRFNELVKIQASNVGVFQYLSTLKPPPFT